MQSHSTSRKQSLMDKPPAAPARFLTEPRPSGSGPIANAVDAQNMFEKCVTDRNRDREEVETDGTDCGSGNRFLTGAALTITTHRDNTCAANVKTFLLHGSSSTLIDLAAVSFRLRMKYLRFALPPPPINVVG